VYNSSRGAFVSTIGQNWGGTKPDGSKYMGFPAELDYFEDQIISAQNPTGKSANINLEISRPRGQRSIVGLTPMLLLADGMPSGLPIQISKNWHEPGNIHWSSFTTTFALPAHTDTELRLRIVYAQYGGVPAASHAQLSLVGWGGGGGIWHESALGSFGEAVCYQPDGQSRRSMITDVRPSQVCNMDPGSQTCKKYAWTENVGGGSFLHYVNTNGSYQYIKQQQSMWPGGVGPCLTNVSYNGISVDGAITQEAGVALGRSDRYNKQFHSIKLKVVKTTAASRLAFYSLGTQGYNKNTFAGVAFGNGAVVENYVGSDALLAMSSSLGYVSGSNRRACGKANSDGSYASGSCWAFLPSSDVAPSTSRGGAYADRGLVVRQWKAVLGGVPVPLPHLSLFKMESNKAVLELSPPPGVSALLEGDFVEALVESVVIPMKASDYWGADADLKASLATLDAEAAIIAATEATASAGTPLWDTARLRTHWQLTALEALSNSPTVIASEGQVENAHPLRVRVDRSTSGATFSVSGGLGYVPFTFSGLPRHCRPVLLSRGTVNQSASYGSPVNQSVAGPYRCRCAGATPTGAPDDPYHWVTHPFPSGSLPCASAVRRCQGRVGWTTPQGNSAATGSWAAGAPFGDDYFQTDYDTVLQEFSVTLNVPVASFGNWAVGAQQLVQPLVHPLSNQSQPVSGIDYKFTCEAPPAPTPAPAAPTSFPTPAVHHTAPPTQTNADTQAPTADTPTAVSDAEQAFLLQGAGCLLPCIGSTPAAATGSPCRFLGHALTACPAFGSCSPTEARAAKDTCLALGACALSQCGVPSDVALVRSPAAAVTVTVLLGGLMTLDLTGNLRLALRTGVANALGAALGGVSIRSVRDSTARRLSEGVTVEFEVAIVDGSAGAVAAMEERVRTQADTLIGFVRASAAELGVLTPTMVAWLTIDPAEVTVTQATVASLPESFVATATLPPTPAANSTATTGPAAAPGTHYGELFGEGHTAYCPLNYYLADSGVALHGGECKKCAHGQKSNGGLSPKCHPLATEWAVCTHVSCFRETDQHCHYHQSANPALESNLTAVAKSGCTGRLAGTTRLSVFYHGSELGGTQHKCAFTGTTLTPAAERACVCKCKDTLFG
jgi:hypothetical protein